MTDLFSNTAESFWTQSVHKKERSAYGQSFLDRNRKKFGGQNRRVYDSLILGNKLDDDIVRAWTPEIRHLHSRISDLNIFGFHIDRRPHPTKDLTIYFMTAVQIEYNKKLLEESINQ